MYKQPVYVLYKLKIIKKELIKSKRRNGYKRMLKRCDEGLNQQKIKRAEKWCMLMWKVDREHRYER